jgi:NADH dehydrogenase
VKRILVTGATGFVGSRFAEQALERGYSVRTFTRTDWAGKPFVPSAERFLGALPLLIPDGLADGVDTVVHFSAYAGASEKASQAVNVEGTIRLVELAKKSGVDAFIYISSSSAKEDAISAYGRSKLAAEKALLAATGIKVVIVRPNLVVGPGRRGVFGNMWKMVEGLPILPMLNGGKSILQPIHIDDLCDALFQVGEKPFAFDRQVLKLGLPEGMTLKSLLQVIAVKALGKKKLAVTVPIWPIEIMVGIAEKLGIPLPIKSANLQGLKVIERADTAPDLAKLGLKLRPVGDFMKGESGPAGDIPAENRAMRTLLVGAGKIGAIHGVILSRMKGMALAGIVDPRPGAAGMLRGMGISVPHYRSIEEAMIKGGADAAVVATPVFTHLPLAKKCADQKMAVMVEKPVALNREQLGDYEKLASGSVKPVSAGWVMARNPHIEAVAKRVKAGEFGAVTGFTGLSLLSSVHKPDHKGWEKKRALSGGGSYIAAGGHVLSMITAALGTPVSVKSQSVSLYSTEVEDTLFAQLDYQGFSGKHYCTWSLKGFNRLESTLVIRTTQGRVWMTPGLCIFVREDGECEVVHQLDFPGQFNMAPDYAGAGFSAEFADLEKAARTGARPPMDILEAVKLEHVLQNIYSSGATVKKLLGYPDKEEFKAPSYLRLAGSPESGKPRKILDLRESSCESAAEMLRQPNAWDAFQFYPVHARCALNAGTPAGKIRFTAPDFLGQTRMLLSGQAAGLLRQMGIGGIMKAGFAATPLVLKEKGATFWVAATGFLAAGLAGIPKGFSGTILLHGYLADLALGVRRPDRLDAMLAIIRKSFPQARIGFHSGMAGEAINALATLDTKVDEVSIISSPGSLDARRYFPLVPAGTVLTAEVGMAPTMAQRLASMEPGKWAHGASAVLVGGSADQYLAGGRVEKIENGWENAFPGLKMPGEVG